MTQPNDQQTAQKSALYDQHIKLTSKSRLVPFAGYFMPLWYSSITEEHQAVRQAAGLFDCTHMGVLEFTGPSAQSFLNDLTVNNVAVLTPGRAQYSCLLDESASILDDIIIYNTGEEKYMVVVNAANAEKVTAWFTKSIQAMGLGQDKLVFRDLRDESAGADSKVDIALQGPASGEVLAAIIDDADFNAQVQELKPFRFAQGKIDGIEMIISRTGYTGAGLGFEVYIAPEKAGWIWELILEKGQQLGAKPCGLGARDSLRIQAGLPLYGHELAGKYNISPVEAGYGWAVKFNKEAFTGKQALEEKVENSKMQVQRFEFSAAPGTRPIREGDAITSADGNCIGYILSSSKIDKSQIALAFVKADALSQDDQAGLYYLARNKRQIEQGKKENVDIDENVQPDIQGVMLARFERF
jgi:glycine cleavage system T protein